MRRDRRPLPVVPPPVIDEALSAWVHRVARYYRTFTERLLEHIGCSPLTHQALECRASLDDLSAIAFAFHVDVDELVRRSFNGFAEPVLSFVDDGGRWCEPCFAELWALGTPTSLREWSVSFATNCRRCGRPMRRWWRWWWILEEEADRVHDCAFRTCAALLPALGHPEQAAALARIMAALATPLPVLARGRQRRLDRPTLYRSPLFRDIARSRIMAPDPARPFGAWNVPARLATLCFLEEFAHDRTVWDELLDRDLIDPDDPVLLRILLARADVKS